MELQGAFGLWRVPMDSKKGCHVFFNFSITVTCRVVIMVNRIEKGREVGLNIWLDS